MTEGGRPARRVRRHPSPQKFFFKIRPYVLHSGKSFIAKKMGLILIGKLVIAGCSFPLKTEIRTDPV